MIADAMGRENGPNCLIQRHFKVLKLYHGRVIVSLFDNDPKNGHSCKTNNEPVLNAARSFEYEREP